MHEELRHQIEAFPEEMMLLCDFQKKLSLIDSRLYIKTDKRVRMDWGVNYHGLYYKEAGREHMKTTSAMRNTVHAKHAEYLEALERGELDKYICGVAADAVPEYDIFSFEHSRLVIPGWRTIAMELIRRKLCSVDRARQVLNCAGLGTQTYDLLTFFNRMAFCKKRLLERSTQSA